MPNLTLAAQFRTGSHIIGRDLYDRCLPESILFKRAAGYFRASAFAVSAEGFYAFFASGGRMQLICSQHLHRVDAEALVTGYTKAPSLIRHPRLDILKLAPPKLNSNLTRLLEWLIATRRLDVRIAVFDSFEGDQIYHEKIGIFEDAAGNIVAFSGSANESGSGLSRNFEVVDVYRSWDRFEGRRAKTKQDDFDRLWRSETPSLRVVPFPQAVRDGLIMVSTEAPEDESGRGAITRSNFPQESRLVSTGLEETLGVPGSLSLKRHQHTAVEEWFKSGGVGLLEMATGSGKTITALAIASALYNLRGGPLVIVIVCPFLQLVHQWAQQAAEFGLDPLLCAYGVKIWHAELAARLYNAKTGHRPLTSLIATNSTFTSSAFQALLATITAPMLFVADEVHNLGSRSGLQSLPANATYRLGLSATPERWYDEEGTIALRQYFGKTVFEYTLEQGLADRVLCPYRYFPILVPLTDDETEAYYKLTADIARLSGDQEDITAGSSSAVEALLLKRSRLIATASYKLPLLRDTLLPLKGSSFNLIYCGDGTVETQPDALIRKQIDAVVRLVGIDCQMLAARYTADTVLDRRDEIRQRFSEGVLQCLVAIRCLDEGVDIPEIRRAFLLASSTNPRQFIQRRGRVLRRAPGKEAAEIYDFIVQPQLTNLEFGEGAFNIARNLFSKELKRVAEFARLAQNGPEAMYSLLPIRKQLHLLDAF